MMSMSLCTMVLALFATAPGETSGWGTGPVEFVAYVNTAEHKEIYPEGAGAYTIEVSIALVTQDALGLLEYKTNVDVSYTAAMGFKPGDMVSVTGTFYSGASPIPYLGRVMASGIFNLGYWTPPEPPMEDPPDYLTSPSSITGAAEATETTVTLHGTLADDGHDVCSSRFVYKEYGGTSWTTAWVSGLSRGSSLTEKISGLIPGTLYLYHMESRNSVGWDMGREGSFTTLEEKVPPIPYPALWTAEPNQVDTTSITMTAGIERDITGPIEYLFDFVASPTGGAGGTDSLWLFTNTYTDVGLNVNHQYGYRVKGRDGNGNETAYSPVRYVYTDIEPPTGVTFGEITTTSIQVKAGGTFSGLTRGASGLKLENTTAGQVSAWQQDDSPWLSAGLLPNTRYAFRAQARNGDGDCTPFCSESRVFTLAIVPATPTISAGGPAGQLTIRWGANGNPTGTQYWCQNTVTNTNSGWISSTQWLDTGLSANVKYSYKVKARNGDGVETAFSAVAQGYSAIETPTGVSFGTPTATAVSVKAAGTLSGLDRDNAGLLFQNVTTGQTSAWRHDNTYWVSDSLLPNQPYGFRVLARNGDGVQTPWSNTAYLYTYANPPALGTFTVMTSTSIQVQWGANGNPAGTLYMCENTTAGMISGWITDTVWDNTSLQPNVAYTYRVKARNGDGIETAWVTLGTQSTDYRSLAISATGSGQVTAPGQGTFRFAPGATVNLVATPAAGYHFLRWTGTAVDAGCVTNPDAAQTTVIVDAHYTLVAHFLRTRIYVDGRSAAGGDGSTWQKAYTYLQDALDTAQTGNEICVAQGTYRPDRGKNVVVGDRFASFNLKDGVRIKGGFVGMTASDPNARDIALYPTLLSGDLKNDDKAASGLYDLYSEATRTDNSVHVVAGWEVGSLTLLEGVTLIGGNGIEGGGLYLFASDPVISRCTIRANRSGRLSGDGTEGWGVGAGVSCYASAPTFQNCVFQSNWAGGEGGGLYAVESQPTLIGCAFRLDVAGMHGGAIYSEDSNSVLINCVFQGNEGWDGGAFYAGEGSDSRLTDCSFFGNCARGSGGAVFSTGRDLRLLSTVLSGNLAFVEGGAVALTTGSASLINCTCNWNVAGQVKGGQTLSVREAVAILTNSILWDSAGTNQALIALTGTAQRGAEVIVSYCSVMGGVDNIWRSGNATASWGTRNIMADPAFVNPTGPDKVAGTEDDDLRLGSSSACIDAGNDTAVPLDIDDIDGNGNRTERLPLDVAGKPRFADRSGVPNTGTADPPAYPAVVDLGAYEMPAQ